MKGINPPFRYVDEAAFNKAHRPASAPTPSRETVSSELLKLKWLSTGGPAWGDHIQRGKPLNNPEMESWLDRGLIQAVDARTVGYVLTEKGRAFVASSK